MGAAVFRQILLMIFFGAIKNRRGLDLGDDWATEPTTLLELGKFLFRGRLLFR